MVRRLPDGMTARVTDTGAVSDASVVTNEVKQHPDDIDCCLPSTSALHFTLIINSNSGPDPLLPSSTIFPASTSAAAAPAPTTTTHNPDAPSNHRQHH
ncbi:hypothetical protein SprV_0100295400 [Sparganum proliferum]